MSDNDTAQRGNILQNIQLIVTIGLAVLGYQLNKEASESNQAISNLETRLKIRQEDRANAEAAEQLRFQLFKEVSTAIEKGNPQQQQAAQSLVISLLEDRDELRRGLLQALSLGAAPSVKRQFEKVVAQESQYQTQQDEVTQAAASIKSPSAPGNAAFSKYYVDVFYCEKDNEALKPRAEALVTYLQGKTGRVRLRLLGETLNSSPGMRVTGLQLRYTPDELGVAKDLQQALSNGSKGAFLLKQVRSPTPNYLSLFVCG